MKNKRDVSNSEFAKEIMGIAKKAESFQPIAAYDPDGDCIEFLVAPDSFYSERIDDMVTVYYSLETKEVIGSLIKGISGFCENILDKYPGFIIEIREGRVKLAHIFHFQLLNLWSQPKPEDEFLVRTYGKLIECAESSKTETEWCLV